MPAQEMPESEQRNQLLEMARTWDNLARDREKLLQNHPELDTSKNLIKARTIEVAIVGREFRITHFW